MDFLMTHFDSAKSVIDFMSYGMKFGTTLQPSLVQNNTYSPVIWAITEQWSKVGMMHYNLSRKILEDIYALKMIMPDLPNNDRQKIISQSREFTPTNPVRPEDTIYTNSPRPTLSARKTQFTLMTPHLMIAVPIKINFRDPLEWLRNSKKSLP
jgi:hypothetical protein